MWSEELQGVYVARSGVELQRRKTRTYNGKDTPDRTGVVSKLRLWGCVRSGSMRRDKKRTMNLGGFIT